MKKEVRRIVIEKGLSVACSRSQRQSGSVFCFRQKTFAIHSRPLGFRFRTLGPFVSLDGKAIGRYSDYEKHTVGQRKCLRTRFGERFFVQRIIELHSVVLGPYEELDVDRIRAIDSI